MRITLPQPLARGRVEAREHPFRAEREHATALNHGHTERPITATNLRFELRRVCGGPERFAGRGVECFRDLVVVHTVEEQRPFVRHGHAGVAAAHVTLPERVGSVGRPFVGENLVVRGDAVAVRTENLRPLPRRGLECGSRRVDTAGGQKAEAHIRRRHSTDPILRIPTPRKVFDAPKDSLSAAVRAGRNGTRKLRKIARVRRQDSWQGRRSVPPRLRRRVSPCETVRATGIRWDEPFSQQGRGRPGFHPSRWRT